MDINMLLLGLLAEGISVTPLRDGTFHVDGSLTGRRGRSEVFTEDQLREAYRVIYAE